MSKRGSRGWRALAATAALLAVTVPAMPVAAEADTSQAVRADRNGIAARNWTDWQTEKRNYNFHSEHWSDKVDVCVNLDFSGDWSFQWLPDGDPDHAPRGYRNLKVSNVRMEAFTTKSCSRTAATFKNVSGADLTETWIPRWKMGKDCDLNSSIAISVPWGVTWSVTPECSNPKLKTASYITHEDGPAHYFFQYNDGESMKISKETSRPAAFCFDLTGDVTVHVQGGGQSGSVSVPAIEHSLCTSRADSKCPGDPTCQNSPKMKAGRVVEGWLAIRRW